MSVQLLKIKLFCTTIMNLKSELLKNGETLGKRAKRQMDNQVTDQLMKIQVHEGDLLVQVVEEEIGDIRACVFLLFIRLFQPQVNRI